MKKNELTCKTCNKHPCKTITEFSNSMMGNASFEFVMRGIYSDFIGQLGCASHSSFKSPEKECGWYAHGLCAHDTDHFQSTECNYSDIDLCSIHNETLSEYSEEQLNEIKRVLNILTEWVDSNEKALAPREARWFKDEIKQVLKDEIERVKDIYD